MTSNYTKLDLAKNLKDKTGYSTLYCKELIDDIFTFLSLNIKSNKFSLKNVGTFKLLKKKERLGRNPKTKESFIITSRKSISFTASNKLIKSINK